METIKQVTKCINTLKDVLNDEYNTINVPEYTEEEIDKLYRIIVNKSNPFSILGNGTSCNLVIDHKILKSHKLHVLFYNFPEIGKSSSKVTKTIIDKIISLYINEVVQPCDNIVIIINEPVSDTIKNMINTLNIQLHNNFDFNKTLVKKELNDKNIKLQKKHFRFATIFDIKTLQYNILNHELIDEHTIIRDIDEINNIINKCNCTIHQLPIISIDDAVGKLKLIRKGDICKIKRTSKACGEYDYYRVCK